MQRFLLLVTLMLLFGFSPPGHTAETPSEYKVKAAYLYNFAKFINWPKVAFADAQSPLVIGVLGDNPFKNELVPLAKKKIRNRTIEIRYFKQASEIKDCHLLYISQSKKQVLESILASLADQPVVTVSSMKNFVNRGGIIQFATKRDRLRFSINLGKAKQQNIQIKAQLLALAADISNEGS